MRFKRFDYPELRESNMKESYDDTLDIDTDLLSDDDYELDYYAIEEEVRDFEQRMRNRLNIPSKIIDAFCDLFYANDITEILWDSDKGLLGNGWKNPPTEEWLLNFCKEFVRHAFSVLGKSLISTKKLSIEEACDLLKDRDVRSTITPEDFVDRNDIDFIEKGMPFKVINSDGYYFVVEPITNFYDKYYNEFEDKTF